MYLQDFNYLLPEKCIAQHPLKKRDQCKLLVVDRAAQTLTDDIFANIGRYLPEKSTLVLNNSKVIPARLFGHREGLTGQVEVFLLKKLKERYTFEVLMRPLKRIKNNDVIVFE